MESPHQQIRGTAFTRQQFQGLYVLHRGDLWARPYNQPPPPGTYTNDIFTPGSYNEGLIPELSKTVAYLNGMVCRLDATRHSYANLLAALHTLEAKARAQAGHLPVDHDPTPLASGPAPIFLKPIPPLTSYLLPDDGHGLIQNISTDRQAALDVAPAEGEGGPSCRLHDREITFTELKAANPDVKPSQLSRMWECLRAGQPREPSNLLQSATSTYQNEPAPQPAEGGHCQPQEPAQGETIWIGAPSMVNSLLIGTPVYMVEDLFDVNIAGYGIVDHGWLCTLDPTPVTDRLITHEELVVVGRQEVSHPSNEQPYHIPAHQEAFYEDIYDRGEYPCRHHHPHQHIHTRQPILPDHHACANAPTPHANYCHFCRPAKRLESTHQQPQLIPNPPTDGPTANADPLPDSCRQQKSGKIKTPA